MPIPGFALFAYAACQKKEERVLVALDARLNQVYMAGVSCSDLSYFIEPQTISPELLPDNYHGRIAGNGFSVYQDKLPPNLVALVSNRHFSYPDATILLDLAKTGRYKPCAPEQAELFYLRDKVALTKDEQQKSKTS
jgi:tRNA threonylcarbamoyladenosine biosynthesis protein TsaB